MNKIPSTSSLQDTVDLLEKALKSLPVKVSKATDAKPILKSSEKDGEQLQKNTTNDLNENTHFPASPLMLCQDKLRCEKTTQEKEEDKESLEQLNTRIQPILKDKVSQVISVVADPLHTISLPDLLDHRVDDRNTEVQQKRDEGMDEPPVPQSEVGLREVTDDADLSVPLQSPEEEHQERATWLQQQKQIEEELPGEILSLQTEEATLQHENAELEGEIQQLKLKLQILHELHDERVGQLYRKFFEEERVCSELDKKLLNVCWDMNSTYQLRNLYKKMAEDLAQEVETCTSYYHKENLFQMQRAEESKRAAVLAERKLEERRRENEHNRQRLAMLEASFQPLPRGNFPPAAPPMAPRGPEVWGIPWAGRTPRKEDGPVMRPQGPGVTCRFDSASTAAGSSAPQPRQDICTGVLFSKEF
nr:cTAGE family member 9-like [Equus asinus]